MRGRYLEVTFREGQPIAAYLHLPRQTAGRSAHTEPMGKGLVADYASDGQVIGVEITAPTAITAEDINAVLEKIGQPALAPDELAPLAA